MSNFLLNSLLKLSKKERNKMIKGLKLETKKHIFNSIYTITEELELDKIDDFETRVKMRYKLIQQFPDTVFWDYAEIANSGMSRKTPVDDFERFPECKVSTNGDIIIISKGTRLTIIVNERSEDYPMININNNKKLAHRISASTFIPKPERLKDISYSLLQVNHIDDTCWNRVISNLEWVTPKENVRHGFKHVKYNNKKYFQFEVMADNGFLGTKFILPEEDLDLLGFNFSNLRKRATASKYNYVNKLKVEMLEEEDVKDKIIGIPDEILNLYKKDVGYFNPDLKPVIGTILEGKYKGFKFSLFGSAEVREYFHRPGVSEAARGDSPSYKGCKFEYVTHKEAIPLHNKLTQEIADNINSNGKYFLLEMMVDNGFKGRKFVLHIENVPIELNTKTIRDIAKVDGKLHYGFKTTQIDYNDSFQFEQGFPEDIKTLFNKNKCYFDPNIKPIIATVLKGDRKGFKFSLFGKQELNRYFNQSCIIKSVNQAMTDTSSMRYGCRLEYATHREAIPLHGKLTDEIAKGLNNILKKYFLFEVIVDNGFLGRKFVISENNIPPMFVRNAIYNSTKKSGNGNYRGFKVNLLTEKDNIEQYEQGFPEDIKELFTINENYFDYKLTPIIVTLLEGELKGLEFSLFGSHERYSLFGHRALKDLYEGKYKHLFRCNIRPATHKEAIPLHTEVTEEIFDYINNYRYK